MIERPECVEDEHLEYLDKLRESGITNKYGARFYIVDEFDSDPDIAGKILNYWMRTFSERHTK